jgi:hypothetical protein
MDEAKVIIDRLRTRMAAIVGARTRMEVDLKKRTAERDKALQRVAELEQKASALAERVRVLELAGGMKEAAGSTKAARLRVNGLLREVDRCIALMNK